MIWTSAILVLSPGVNSRNQFLAVLHGVIAPSNMPSDIVSRPESHVAQYRQTTRVLLVHHFHWDLRKNDYFVRRLRIIMSIPLPTQNVCACLY